MVFETVRRDACRQRVRRSDPAGAERLAKLRRTFSLAVTIMERHTPEPTTPKLPIPIHPVTDIGGQRNRPTGKLLTADGRCFLFLTTT